MANRSTRPKYYLTIKDKNNAKAKTLAGALFESEYGFNLKLHPGIVIRWDDEVFLNISPPRMDYRSRHGEELQEETSNPDGVQYGDEPAMDIEEDEPEPDLSELAEPEEVPDAPRSV